MNLNRRIDGSDGEGCQTGSIGGSDGEGCQTGGIGGSDGEGCHTGSIGGSDGEGCQTGNHRSQGLGITSSCLVTCMNNVLCRSFKGWSSQLLTCKEW